jgi:hypothetical protein
MKLFSHAKEFKAKNDKMPLARTTIGITKSTHERLNKNRAPGQCYDGFICQLIELWEKNQEGKLDYVQI